MAAFPYPKPAPARLREWIGEGFSWIYTNVLWGGAAILLGIFIPVLFGAEATVSNDAILAITVLGITICATQIEFPPELPVRQQSQKLWLTRVAVMSIAGGAVIAAFSAPIPLGNAARPGHELMLKLSIVLCLIAIVTGLWLSVLRTLALGQYLTDIIQQARAGESYAGDLAAAQQGLIGDAKSATEVDGVKL